MHYGKTQFMEGNVSFQAQQPPPFGISIEERGDTTFVRYWITPFGLEGTERLVVNDHREHVLEHVQRYGTQLSKKVFSRLLSKRALCQIRNKGEGIYVNLYYPNQSKNQGVLCWARFPGSEGELFAKRYFDPIFVTERMFDWEGRRQWSFVALVTDAMYVDIQIQKRGNVDPDYFVRPFRR